MVKMVFVNYFLLFLEKIFHKVKNSYIRYIISLFKDKLIFLKMGIDLRNNLITLMEECKISLVELHKNTGVPITTIQRMRADVNANPTISSLQPIADFFRITVDQLIGSQPLPTGREQGSFVKQQKGWTDVPIITWAEVIQWPDNKLTRNFVTISIDVEISNDSFALIIQDTLIDFFKDSAIIVDPETSYFDTSYVIAYKKGAREATLKQIKFYDENIYLKPLSDEFKTTMLDDSYKIVGTVKQVRRDFKFEYKNELSGGIVAC